MNEPTMDNMVLRLDRLERENRRSPTETEMAILLTLVVGLLFATAVEAKPILTVTCEEPRGTRFDYDAGLYGLETKVEEHKTTFSGVNPVFVVDDQKPTILLVIWGPAKKAVQILEPLLGKGRYQETKAKEATIIWRTANQITAVEGSGSSIWFHSLYPKLGIGYFSRHSYLMGANSSSYYAMCKFASGD